MNIVEKKLYNLNPRYLEKYKPLLSRFAQFGGGANEDKYIKGKSFFNVYEFYIYAFFIGIYQDKHAELVGDDKLSKFMEIKFWKPEELVNNLLVCSLARSDFDMSAIEYIENESKIEQEIGKLRHTIECYANGGLGYIHELVEENPDDAERDEFFISLLS